MFYRILWLLASKREGYGFYSRILFSLSAKQIRIIKQPPAGGCFIVFTRSTVPLRIPRSCRTPNPVSISVTFIFPCYLQYTASGSVCRYWRIMRDAGFIHHSTQAYPAYPLSCLRSPQASKFCPPTRPSHLSQAQALTLHRTP